MKFKQLNNSKIIQKKQNKHLPLELIFEIFKVQKFPLGPTDTLVKLHKIYGNEYDAYFCTKAVRTYMKNHIIKLLKTSKVIHLFVHRWEYEMAKNIQFIAFEDYHQEFKDVLQLILNLYKETLNLDKMTYFDKMADDESKKTDNSNKQVEKAVNTPQKETRKREADIDLLEGSSTGKRAKRVSEESPGRKNAKILLSQQEDGHCPQCGSFASNWSVHCRTNHREFVDYGGDFVVAHRHEVYQFISQCLQKLGASEHHSSVLAKYLTFCDTFGYSSEGLQKLNYYVDMLIADKFSAFGEPRVLEETGYSFKIDCSGILGPLAADFCASKTLSFDIGKEPKAVMGIVNAEFSSEFPCVPELMDFCADSLYRSTKNGIIISRNSMTSFVNERKLNALTHKKEDFIGVHNFLSGGVDAKSNTMYFITKGSQKTGRKEPKINNLEDYKNFIEPFITKIIESKVYLDWNKRKHNYEERSRKLGGTKYDLVYFKDVYEKLAALVKTWPIDIEMFEVY